MARHRRISDWSELLETASRDEFSWPDWRILVTAAVLVAALCIPALVLRFR